MKGKYEQEDNEIRRKKQHSRAPNRISRRMGCCSQRAVDEGKRVNPATRPVELQTARVALGQGGETVCLRWAGGQGSARRPLRRTQPIDRLSFHVRSRLERGLPNLLGCSRAYQFQLNPSCATRRDADRDFKGTHCADRSV